MANDRISQLPVEAVVSPTSGKARTSQEPVEVVVSPTSGKARTSQEPVEVVVSPTSGKARTSQAPVEVIVSPTSGKARISQAAVEVVVENVAIQTVSVALISQTAATFTPTVTATATISVALINQTATPIDPTIATQQFISVALLNQAAAPFAPSVGLNVSVGLIDQTASTFNPTVTPGAVDISVALIDRTATASTPTITTTAGASFGLLSQPATPFTPTVIPGAVNVSFALINQTATTNAPTISSLQIVAPDFLNQAASTFTPTIANAQIVSVGLIHQEAIALAAAVGVQFARPDSNVTQTNFTNGFANIDEQAASDADFAFGANNTAAVLEVGLSDVTDPQVPGGHIFRYRIAKTNAGTLDGTGNAVTVTAQLIQGTTVIASDSAKTATGTWTSYAYTLTSTEADSITSYTDLRLRFTTSASGGGPSVRRGGAVSWAELQVPLAGMATALVLPFIDDTAALFAPTINSSYSISVALINQSAAAFSPSMSVPQVVAPSLIDQTAATFTPTIAQVAGISVALIDQTAATFTPTVSTQYSISVGLLSQTASPFTPTISVGAAALSVGLIDQTAATFTPTVSATASISLALISQTAATFSPTITAGAVTISFALLNQAASAFGPSVSFASGQNVDIALLNQAASPFTPTVTSLNTISVGLISNPTTAYAPVVASYGITFELIDRSAWAYAPVVTGGDQGIVLLYDGINIIDDVVIADASFSTLANGQPGQCSFRVKDPTAAYSFVAGKPLLLRFEGTNVWRGFVANVKRIYAFDAQNTFDPTTLIWLIEGFDINILFTKRIVFKRSNPIDLQGPTYTANNTFDTTALTALFRYFLDLSSDGIDTTTLVEHVGYVNIDHPSNPIQPAGTWANTMTVINSLTNAIYYIDPDKRFVHTDVDVPNAPWDLSDTPDGVTSVGYRDMELVNDGTNLINDMLVWGMALGGSHVVIAREEDATSIAAHGRWQAGELNGGMYKQATVDRRASSIVDGSPLSKRGAKNDKVSVAVTTFTPGFRVAQKVDFSSEVYGFNDVIPIRRMDVSFATKTQLRYRLFLSHEIDMPWNYFDNYYYNFKIPAINVTPPGGLEFPPTGDGGTGTCDCIGPMTTYDDFTRTTGIMDWGQPSSGYQAWSTGSPLTETYVDGSRAVIPYDVGVGNDSFDILANGAGIGHIVNPPWGSAFIMQATVSYDTAVPGPVGNYEWVNFTFRWDGQSQIRQVSLYIGNEPDDQPVFQVATLGGGSSSSVNISAPPPNTPIYIMWESSDAGEKGKIWWGTDPEPDWMVSYVPTLAEPSPLRNFRVGGSTSYSHESYVDDILFSTDLCGQIQFESFARTVSSGWGIATSGATWSSSGTGTASVNNAGLIRTSSGNSRSLSITPPVSSTYEMTSSVRFSTIPSSTNYLRTIMDLSGGCYLQLDVSSGSPGMIYLGSGGNQVSVAKTNWVSSSDYRIRESWDAGTGALKVKVWRQTEAEPSTWTLETTAAGPIGSLTVSGTNSGAGSNRDMTFSFIEFGYADKPCYPGGCVDPTTEYTDTFTRTTNPGWGTSDSGLIWAETDSGVTPTSVIETTGTAGRIYVPHPTTLDHLSDDSLVILGSSDPDQESFRILYQMKIAAQDLTITDITPFVSFHYGTCSWFLETGGVTTGHGQKLEIIAFGASPNNTSIQPYVLTTDTWYWVRWENDWQIEERLKIWSGNLGDEPDGWTLRLASGGQSGADVEFRVYVEQGGSSLSSLGADFDVLIDNLVIDVGCGPAVPTSGVGAPDSGNYCQYVNHGDAENDFSTSKAFVYGTLKVWVNGTLTTAFTFNADAGTFHLTTAIDSTDTLYVCYMANGDPI